MNRKKRRIGIGLLLLLVLIGFPVLTVYREMQQERLDHALIAAIKAEDNQKILVALTEGASGEARDTGEPPTFREVLQQLLDRFLHPSASPSGKSGNDEHLPALLLLCQTSNNPDLTLVRALLDHGARVNDRYGNGSCLLSEAINHVDVVKLLLERGADTETEDIDGDTPLMLAFLYSDDSHEACIKVLLEHGANTETRRKGTNETALILAAEVDKPTVVRILLEHGAKVATKDNNGQTALVFVKHKHDPASRKIEALLRKYGAR